MNEQVMQIIEKALGIALAEMEITSTEYDLVKSYFEVDTPDEYEWQDVVPTHIDEWQNLYAKWRGKWYCFHVYWQAASNKDDRFFESSVYYDDMGLKPLK